MDVLSTISEEEQIRLWSLQHQMNATWCANADDQLVERGIEAFHRKPSVGMGIVMIGLPGSGKTTATSTLEESHQAKRLRVKQVAIANGLDTEADRARGTLIQGADDAFAEEAAKLISGGELLVLDGFPRSVNQALVMLEAGIKPLVFHIFLPMREELNLSVARQIQRDQAKGAEGSVTHYLNKIERAVEQDQAALRFLQLCNVPIFSISGTERPEVVSMNVDIITRLYRDGANLWPSVF